MSWCIKKYNDLVTQTKQVSEKLVVYRQMMDENAALMVKDTAALLAVRLQNKSMTWKSA